MKSSLRLATRQQLALTPQIQQTIRMLQLGARELGEEIDQVLTSNPLLQEKSAARHTSDETDRYSSWLQNQPDPSTTGLEEHLIQQLGLTKLNNQVFHMACFVISRLDDDGYLRLHEQQLLTECADEQLDANPAILRTAIEIVRSLEPAGIACRDLGQCLGQQMIRNHPSSPTQQHALLLCKHLEQMADDPSRLQSRLGLEDGDFQQAKSMLTSLDPAPGSFFDQQPTCYIQPDILLIEHNGLYQIRLNPTINRGIELNENYIGLLKTSTKPSDTEYLRQNMNKARWWLNALEQRNRTLLAVAEYMVDHQVTFFKQGELALKPLKQQTIADSLDMNISTISRAINNKYIQTSSGVIALDRLLAGSIARENGFPLSNEAVKAIIINLIKNEPSQTPLSDANIVLNLNKRGILIARRTVSKYREQLNIPPSNRRKLH